MTDRDEEEQSQSVVMQNSQSILAARLKAERELLNLTAALAQTAEQFAVERE